MKHPKEWHQRRKTGITGSDIAAIAGLSPYKTPIDIFLDKTTDYIDEAASEAAHWGNMLEDAVAKEYCDRNEVTVSEEPNLLRHPEHKFMIGNIDRWVGDKEYILECKTGGLHLHKQLGEEGTDQMPEHWLLQVAWYCAIAGAPKADIAVLVAGQEYKQYTYIRNLDMENTLIRIAKGFWENHVLTQTPPNDGTIKALNEIYPVDLGSQITSNEAIDSKLSKLHQLVQQQKDLEKSIQSTKLDLQEYIGDNSELVNSDGKVLASWKTTKPRLTFSTKIFKEKHPDLYKQFLIPAKTSRRFLIKEDNDE